MKLLRFPEVVERVRITRTTIYRMIKEGSFPRPIKQGNAAFWVDGEIEAYLEKLMTARPSSQPRLPSA